MSKQKKILILVLIVGVLFTSVACTSNQYTQEDIDALKFYSHIYKEYDYLQLFNSELIWRIDRIGSALDYLEDYNRNPKYLDEYLKREESQLAKFESIAESMTSLIEAAKIRDIDLSDIMVILNNMKLAIDFLDETNMQIKKYSETGDFNNYHLTEILTNMNTYTNVLLDNFTSCINKKLELYDKIQNY